MNIRNVYSRPRSTKKLRLLNSMLLLNKIESGWYLSGDEGHVLVTEFRGINCLFCADVLRPLDLVHLTDFTDKYHHVYNYYSQN